MSFSFTEEQEELRAVVRSFLAEKSPSNRVRALMESSGYQDHEVWAQMAEQLGLQGLAIPEEYGGAGCGPVELGVVVEEMGRSLLVAPYFSTVVLAGQVLTCCADERAKRRWLPSIADGSLTATVAVADGTGEWDLDAIETTAEPTDSGWAVTGTKMHVLDGHTADLVLVVAQDRTGVGLFAVDGEDAEVTRLDAVDQTRGLARVELAAVPATRIGPESDAAEWLGAAGDLVLAAWAAEQIGGAARCLDMTVEYAKTRVQFGRFIGSFQAIKHKCAEMLVDVESGKSAAYHASSAVAESGAESSMAAVLAKTYCSEAFTRAAKETIQIHGGIGFTWEHDAHLYLKRAKTGEALFGSPATLRARLADLVGI